MPIDRRTICLLLVLVPLLTFGHSLSNGFVGDDLVKLVHTDYYADRRNLLTLFSVDYLSDPAQYGRSQVMYAGSGEISYRPVCTLTFFFDRAIWDLNPFGYHFTNLLIHILNGILVFICLELILKDKAIALLAALLFSVHPLQAETVNAISYRHGLLAAMFALMSIIFYRVHRSKNKRRYLFLSLLSLLFALFSKEIAVTAIFIIVAEQAIFEEQGEHRFKELWLFAAAGLIYGFVYFFVFPNTVTGGSHWKPDIFLNRLPIIIQTAGYYIKSIALPFTVKLLPLGKVPPGPMPIFVTIVNIILLALVFVFPFLFRKNKVLLFASFWFLLTLLPVINLIPLVNPIAHRRMYFPMTGMLILMAYGLRAAAWAVAKERQEKALKVLALLLIGSCMLISSQLTSHWKNNVVYAEEVLRHYPRDQKAYYVLGNENFRVGLELDRENDCRGAVPFLLNARSLGVQDERIDAILLKCRADGPGNGS